MSTPETQPTDLVARQLRAERYLSGEMDPDAYFAEVEAEAVAIAEEDLRWLIERIRREEETGIDLRSVTGPSVEVSPELAARAGIPAEKASSKLGKGILGLLSRFH